MKTKCCTKCKKIKLISEFHVKSSKNGTFESMCKVCRNEKQRNVKKYKDRRREKREKNRLENNSSYKKILERNKIYYENNKECLRKYSRMYAKKYPAKNTAKNSKYRAKKLNATPLWADEERISKIYEFRDYITHITGNEYHVDHIIPLQGENICGLHIHNNLQILPARINIIKSNKLII